MKYSIFILFLCLFHSFVWAQDYHTSNIQNISQLHNPAVIGLRNDMEAGVSYRTQWRSVGSPFTAIGASFYSTTDPDHRKQDGHLTLGLNAYREQMSRTGSATSVTMNVAQHIALTKRSTLSLGMNFGVYARSINEENGMWESQHNGLFYDQNLASGEVFESTQRVRFDIGSGMVYSFRTRQQKPLVRAGFAAYHLNQPDISYTSSVVSVLPIRSVLFTSFVLPLGKKSPYSLEGTLLYQNQRKFHSFMIGGMVKAKLVEKVKTTSANAKLSSWDAGIGMYIRGKDAFIINAQLERSEWKASLAYDMTFSTLKNHSKGAVEFQLSYTIPKYVRELLY